jgi:capsular polysaccharide biosynthesis protein
MQEPTTTFPDEPGAASDTASMRTQALPPRPPGGGLPHGVLAVVVVIVFAALIALATYFVSNSISPTYRSSTEVRVSVVGSSGLGQDSLLGANQLTAQLVQLVPTDAILAVPAQRLGTSISKLRSSVSAGSVAQQNLLQISATAGTSAGARQRAADVTQYFLGYMARDSRRQLAAYAHGVSGTLGALTSQIARITAELTTRAGRSHAAALETELGSLTSGIADLKGRIGQRQASSAPLISIVQSARDGSKVAPRPVLYAVVGGLVAAFVAAQLAFLAERRRTARA